jgi:dihydrofolate synthase/folylpolyglutamate synthase
MTAPPDPYREALERLYGRERGNKGPFGLEGTRALLDDLGHPERAFPSVHVAGTNGKGSTSALIERCLRAAGLRTGLFTSPHLIDFRERIRLSGCAASADAVAARLARIATLPHGAGRTFFEATFALAALSFAEERVDVAVLETGLGGRLDSTNVVTPALCVLTPIGLDHTELLGDTLEAIAREKAGILKRGVPAVTAAQDARAAAVLEAAARAVGAPLEDALDATGTDVSFRVRDWGVVRARLRLLGRHQVDNALLAAAAFRALADAPSLAKGPPLTKDALAEGLAHARWPGRFEASASEPRLFWDGAHNPQGAAVLRAAWRDVTGDAPAVLVLGLSEDKDAKAVLSALHGPWRRVCAVSADQPRACAADAVAQAVRTAWPGTPVAAHGSVADGVRSALTSLGPNERVLVCGSLFVVGEAMAAVGDGELTCV